MLTDKDLQAIGEIIEKSLKIALNNFFELKIKPYFESHSSKSNDTLERKMYKISDRADNYNTLLSNHNRRLTKLEKPPVTL